MKILNQFEYNRQALDSQDPLKCHMKSELINKEKNEMVDLKKVHFKVKPTVIPNSNETMKMQEEGESIKPKVIAQTSSLFLGPVPKDQESSFAGPVQRNKGSVGSLLSSNSNFSVAIGLHEFCTLKVRI